MIPRYYKVRTSRKNHVFSNTYGYFVVSLNPQSLLIFTQNIEDLCASFWRWGEKMHKPNYSKLFFKL